MPICCNPQFMYEETLKYISFLQRLGLRIIKVFVDSITNLDKVDTYIERRSQKDEFHKNFWSSLNQEGTFSPMSLGRNSIDIPNCCMDAVIKAFINECGEDVLSFGGIDTDRYV